MIKNLCWLVRGGEKTTNYNHIYSHTSWAPSRVITRSYSFGCFFKWWYPQNTPKWSFLVGKPWLLGTIILGNSHLLWGPHFTPFTTIDPRPTLQSSFSMDFSVPLCYFSTEVVVYPCMSLKNAMALPVLRSHRSGAFWGINDEQQRKYRSPLVGWVNCMAEYARIPLVVGIMKYSVIGIPLHFKPTSKNWMLTMVDQDQFSKFNLDGFGRYRRSGWSK